jgi:molybdate transport system substrate-binding protein
MKLSAGAAVLVAVAITLAGASLASATARDDEPTVFAASSLTDVFPQIEPDAKYNFGGSNLLAFQIEQGAPADVFAAASTSHPQKLYKEGLVEQPVVFATNRLVLAVPKSNPGHVRSVYDLKREDVSLVVANPAAPVGAYTQKVLTRLGLAKKVHVVSEEPDVRSILSKIVLADADAGFVYKTDVRTVPKKVIAIKIPAKAQPRIAYAMAVVKNAPHIDSARAFVFRVLGAWGRKKLAAAGFGLP